MGHDSVRWSFLEEQSDPCAVVTRRMTLLYLNAAARPLVPQEWFGSRCWEVFPVTERNCACRCPAVRAVTHPDETDGIRYCEETLDTGKNDPLVLGVAIVPLSAPLDDGAQGILLMRPMAPEEPEEPEAFRDKLVADAQKLISLLAALD